MDRSGVDQQSSPVQQMMVGRNPNKWWNMMMMMMNTTTTTTTTMHPRPAAPQQQQRLPATTDDHPPNINYSNFPLLINPPPPPPYVSANSSSLIRFPNSNHDDQDPILPHYSWSQLLMSTGLVLEEDKARMWGEVREEEEKIMVSHHQPPNVDHPKQVSSVNMSYVYELHGNQEFQAAAVKPSSSSSCTWTRIIAQPPAPAAASSSNSKSCAAASSTPFSMLDFSNNTGPLSPDPSNYHQCISGALKKARVQPSTTHHPTLKVRKEKLGDRITVLHQLVSPFGKTDTASVLLEAIGYIRFLQSQIEALSLPYLGSGSGKMRHRQYVEGEKNCIFPENPRQLDSEEEEEEKKVELRSRGLCLVPISCTVLQVGSDNNGADHYWASPAFVHGGFR